MELNELTFEIKEGGAFLKITPLNLVDYNSPDIYDDNWIRVHIEVKSSFLSGNYGAFFQVADFYNLRDNLTKLYENFNEKMVFTNLEYDLQIEVEGDGFGHFKTKILAFEQHSDTKLEYVINIDQTHIAKMLIQVERIIKLYPKANI